MTSAMMGLWHVRNGPAASVTVLIALAIVVYKPQLLIVFDMVFEEPARGLATVEIVGIVLVSVLPALTAPAFDGRERLMGPLPRLVHTATTLIVFLAPLLILPLWKWRMSLDLIRDQGTGEQTRVHTDDELYAVTFGSAGNLVLFAAIGVTLFLLLGRLTSVLVTPMLCIAFIMSQQAFPDTVLTTWFAHPAFDWHTNWAIAGLLTLMVTALTWARRCVPPR